MIIRLNKYDYVSGYWTPSDPPKFMSTVSRIRKGYTLDKKYFQYPYGRGDIVATACLAKWTD